MLYTYKMTKQELLDKWYARKLSWSQLSAFRDYNKQDWFDSYILGNKKPPNARMEFGSRVGKKLETDPNFLPEIPREGIMEYGVEAKLESFALTGFMDSFCKDKLIINEFKTSSPNGWSQSKVDSHQQLDFYALLLYLKHKIKPEDITIRLHHLHTQENNDFTISLTNPVIITTYETKRTLLQVLKFAGEIKKIRNEMEKYIEEYERSIK